MQGLNHSFFEAIALDFDGTLVDSDKTHLQSRLMAYEQLAEDLSEPRLARIDAAIHAEGHHHGSHAHEINSWVIAEAGIAIEGVDLATEIVERKNEYYMELVAEGLEARPGAVDFMIVALRRWSEKTAIVTTAHSSEVHPFLANSGLSNSFSEKQLITREDVENLKPDPEAYELAIERMGLSNRPERLLAVEDTPRGVQAAKAAGATVIGLVTPDYQQSLQKATGLRKPHTLAGSFPDIRRMIGLEYG